MGQSTPVEQLEEARMIARTHNMFVVSKGERFSLFRRTSVRPVFLGERSSAAELRSLVSRCARSK